MRDAKRLILRIKPFRPLSGHRHHRNFLPFQIPESQTGFHPCIWKYISPNRRIPECRGLTSTHWLLFFARYSHAARQNFWARGGNCRIFSSLNIGPNLLIGSHSRRGRFWRPSRCYRCFGKVIGPEFGVQKRNGLLDKFGANLVGHFRCIAPRSRR